MTNRKVASLTSGLLARKGTARPADLAADLAEADVAASSAPAVPPSVPADVADRNAAAERDLRAYAWPTQGATADDDLAMPVPPATVDPAEEAAAAVRRRGTARRLAIFGIATAVVAAVIVIVVRDGRQDAARLATATAPAGVPAMPSSPAVAPDVAASRAMEDAARTVRDAAPAGVTASPSPATVVPHKAAHRATKDAARTVRDIAPAAGTLSSPSSAEFELAPRVPPAPAMKIAALPPATTESSAPVSAAALAPPPIDLPPEKATSVERAPAPKPKPRVAARTSAASISAAKKSAKSAAAGRYAVQIASIGSQSRAAAERVRLARHLGPVLGGRALIVEQATVAGHGTVYRIRAAGYPNQAAAKKACTQIRGRGQGCLVVRL